MGQRLPEMKEPNRLNRRIAIKFSCETAQQVEIDELKLLRFTGLVRRDRAHGAGEIASPNKLNAGASRSVPCRHVGPKPYPCDPAACHIIGTGDFGTQLCGLRDEFGTGGCA